MKMSFSKNCHLLTTFYLSFLMFFVIFGNIKIFYSGEQVVLVINFKFCFHRKKGLSKNTAYEAVLVT